MKNFYRLAQGINTVPIVAALHMKDLWDKNTFRTKTEGSHHKEASDIWLRFKDVQGVVETVNSLDVQNYEWDTLPQIHPLVFNLMREVGATRLGSVVITRLKPGGRIEPHEDSGPYAEAYKRFHIILQNQPGSLFDCGDESVFMATGEVWWFNHREVHAVVNNSGDDRITMIVDLQC